MNINMNDTKLHSPGDIRAFLGASCKLKFSSKRSDECRAWIAHALSRTRYSKLCKADKSSVKEYLERISGYSRAQMTRLIMQYRLTGKVIQKKSQRPRFSRRYTREDVLLLAKVDEAHQTLSGSATKKLLERAYRVFNKLEYKRLAEISVAHIYNLRANKTYKQRRMHYTKTKPTPVKIGERRKPQSNGKPGLIRIDTVHQGDRDKVKGLYHINAVDELTQYQVICSVERISEQYLIPVLEEILVTFPFKITGFHSDNGSEYVNQNVAKLLDKLHIEFTKSRPRKSNDNGLVECKNGAVVRKVLGYYHIPQKWAPKVNAFNRDYVIPYLNYHRPCHFPVVIRDEKGKERKTYPQDEIKTPYEKLKSIPGAASYLHPGITFEDLDKEAIKQDDEESAIAMNKAKNDLLKIILHSNPGAQIL